MSSAGVIYIQISNIKNPSIAAQSGNFQFFIKYLNGSIIDQSPAASSGIYSSAISFLAGRFYSCAVSAGGNYISTYSSLLFTFNASNPIPSTGLLVIDIPLQWDGDMMQYNTIISSPACTAVSGLAVSSLPCTYTIFPSPISKARVSISSLSVTGI